MGSSALLTSDRITIASGVIQEYSSHHARKAEKLITLIAIPAYDPINIVKIILIITCPMDVWVIKARFGERVCCEHPLITPKPIISMPRGAMGI